MEPWWKLYINRIKGVFDAYKSDKYLNKIICAINIFLTSVQTRNPIIIKLIPSFESGPDSASEIAHAGFELYILKRFNELDSLLRDYNNLFVKNGIGVSITKHMN